MPKNDFTRKIFPSLRWNTQHDGMRWITFLLDFLQERLKCQQYVLEMFVYAHLWYFYWTNCVNVNVDIPLISSLSLSLAVLHPTKQKPNKIKKCVCLFNNNLFTFCCTYEDNAQKYSFVVNEKLSCLILTTNKTILGNFIQTLLISLCQSAYLGRVTRAKT